MTSVPEMREQSLVKEGRLPGAMCAMIRRIKQTKTECMPTIKPFLLLQTTIVGCFA
jgi:hypothetical protein